MTRDEAPRPSGSASYRWKPWKLGTIALAALLVAGGALLAGTGSGGRESPAVAPSPGLTPGASSSGLGAGADQLLPGSSPTPAPHPGPTSPEPSAVPGAAGDGSEVPWSPALVRGGLSFFVAFGVGFAFRAFLRIGLFFVGLWAASLFLLASMGWVEVHWSAMDAAFSGWTAGLGSQFESASRFITGSLPSAGMAVLGLYTGLRRR